MVFLPTNKTTAWLRTATDQMAWPQAVITTVGFTQNTPTYFDIRNFVTFLSGMVVIAVDTLGSGFCKESVVFFRPRLSGTSSFIGLSHSIK